MKLGYFTAILSAIFFGFAGVIIRLISILNINYLDLIILQYLLTVIVFIVVFLVFNANIFKISKSQMLYLFILGTIGDAFMTVFYYRSFYYLPVGIATTLLYTAPLFIYLYNTILGIKKFKFKSFFVFLLVLAGCIMTFGTFNINCSVLGIAFGILGAIFFAFMNIFASTKLTDVNSISVTFYSILFSLIPLLIYRFPDKQLISSITFKGYIYIIILALICSSLPLMLFYYSIKRIGSLKTSIIGNLEIPTAIITGFVLFNESINIAQLIGILLIIVGIFILEKDDI